jgi:hypothetical protein
MRATYIESLADICTVLGFIALLIKIVDWSLLSAHKLLIKNLATHVGFWLSEQKAGRYLKLVRSRNAQRFFSILMHIAAMALTLSMYFELLYLQGPTDRTFHRFFELAGLGVVLLSTVLVGFWWHPQLMAWVAKPESVLLYFARLWAASLVSFLAFYGYISLLFIISDSLRFNSGWPALTAKFIAFMAIFPLGIESFTIMLIFVLSMHWMIFIFLTMLLFKMIELFCSRIVEQDNGPAVVSVGLILVATGVTVKLLM